MRTRSLSFAALLFWPVLAQARRRQAPDGKLGPGPVHRRAHRRHRRDGEEPQGLPGGHRRPQRCPVSLQARARSLVGRRGCRAHRGLGRDAAGHGQERVLKTPATPELLAQVNRDNNLLLSRVQDRSNKVQAPEMLRPSGRFPTVDAVKAAFSQSRDKSVEFVKAAPRTCTPTPRRIRCSRRWTAISGCCCCRPTPAATPRRSWKSKPTPSSRASRPLARSPVPCPA